MTEAAILLACLVAFVPDVAKGFYRGVSVLVADHILHEALVCTEEIRRPSECQKNATDSVRRVLPWFDDVNFFIQMDDRTYRGDLKLVFDRKHTHRKTMEINMEKWK